MTTLPFSIALLITAAGVYASTQNTLASGGSLITFPALLLVGLDPLDANTISTITLFPSQVTSSIAGRRLAGGIDIGEHHLSLRRLIVINLVGGVLGALLLLATPPSFSVKLVPHLVLFATSVFVWGSFCRKPLHAASGMSTTALATAQFAIAIYGSYFGGGISSLILAALTVAGQQVRMTGATESVLATAMNASAVAVFTFSPQVNWTAVVALDIEGIAGGFAGAWLLHQLPERVLRGFVIIVGIILAIWLFIRAWMQRPLAA